VLVLVLHVSACGASILLPVGDPPNVFFTNRTLKLGTMTRAEGGWCFWRSATLPIPSGRGLSIRNHWDPTHVPMHVPTHVRFYLEWKKFGSVTRARQLRTCFWKSGMCPIPRAPGADAPKLFGTSSIFSRAATHSNKNFARVSKQKKKILYRQPGRSLGPCPLSALWAGDG